MNNWSWKDKTVLITGGTGSLGNELTKQLMKMGKEIPKAIRIYSRDELKQWEMRKRISSNYIISYLIGDVRDKERLLRAMEGVDVVIHAAALKQIGACEYNPLEAVKTNIWGTVNVVDCALDAKVNRVMFVSTDKAVQPINLYGATKMAAEKVIIHGNVYRGSRKFPIMSACRYGNVLGSRGSVVKLFREQVATGKSLSITHPEMTRFWITLPQVARFLLNKIKEMKGEEIFVPKMPSMYVINLARIIYDENKKKTNKTLDIDIVGMRKGEKLHEVLINKEEWKRTEAREWDFVIRPNAIQIDEEENWTFQEYTSYNNPWKMRPDEAKRILKKVK